MLQIEGSNDLKVIARFEQNTLPPPTLEHPTVFYTSVTVFMTKMMYKNITHTLVRSNGVTTHTGKETCCYIYTDRTRSDRKHDRSVVIGRKRDIT